jgi:ABC-type sugar transport system permease subunit/ABC-type glycerol-3-phosphate transport system substrate-binding protein
MPGANLHFRLSFWRELLVLVLFLLVHGKVRGELPKNEPVTVRVFSLPSASHAAPGDLAAYEVLKKFHELHPSIRLQSATSLKVEGVGMDAAPLMAIAGGTSPDIVYVNFRQSDTYIREGFLYPLDEYFAQLSPEEIADRIPEAIKPVVFREGPDGKSHYWAMPQDVVVTLLLYRKDLFAQAGLDPAHPPKNWSEMRQYAERLTDPARGQYGFSLPIGPAGAWGILPFLSSAGSHAVVQNEAGQWKAAFDTHESVLGYRFAAELMKAKVTKGGREGPVVYRGFDFNEMNSAGRVGMYFGYLGGREVAKFNPDVVAAGRIPAGPNGLSSGEVNAQMLGIFAGVKDKRVRDAAWAYLKFVGSKEAREVYTRTMVKLGAAHLLNPLWLEEFGFDELAKLAPPGLIEAYREGLKTGTPEPYGKNCQFVYNYMSRPLDRLYYTDFERLPQAEGDALIGKILREAVQETNERMLGELPPEDRARRNTISWAVVFVVAVIFVSMFRLVVRWMAPGISKTSPASDRHRGRLAFFFLLPALALILVWQYYPLLRGSFMAFQDYRIMGGSPWVGISNFADVLYDGRFWHSLLNAVWFCALWMLMGFFPPVALAVILQEIPLGKMAFRLLFYIPAVVSGVVILFMWRGIYDPSPDGLLNRAMGLLGLPAQSWLQDPKLAMICVVFPLAWANLGPGSIIYLAALKSIPEELYEASDIDGAGFWRKLWSIVLPYLKPLLVINAMGATIFGFKSADAILAMTGGGPDNATQVVGYEIWQRSFLFLQFGQATAMAWILALILLVFIACQMRVLARVEFRTAR